VEEKVGKGFLGVIGMMEAVMEGELIGMVGRGGFGGGRGGGVLLRGRGSKGLDIDIK